MAGLSPGKAAEVKVLAALASGGTDFGCFDFRHIAGMTRLNRKTIRRACRSLARKGLASFHRGCWTEDGEPAGSGYAATKTGREQAVESMVERYAARRWE